MRRLLAALDDWSGEPVICPEELLFAMDANGIVFADLVIHDVWDLVRRGASALRRVAFARNSWIAVDLSSGQRALEPAAPGGLREDRLQFVRWLRDNGYLRD